MTYNHSSTEKNEKKKPAELDSSAPIGMFDSGSGGLTVALDFSRFLPNERLIYVGDHAHFPFGEKPIEEVREYCLEICRWLVEQGVKMIVIACNTATVCALQAAQEQMPVPVVGVIEAGSRAAVSRTATGKIGVLATQATVSSGVFEKIILSKKDDAQVISVGAPKLVELAEMGIKHLGGVEGDSQQMQESFNEYSDMVSPQNMQLARKYAEPMIQASVDTVICGCTHFALLKPLLNAVFGPCVMLVSCGRETMKDAKDILKEKGLLNDFSAEASDTQTEVAAKKNKPKDKFDDYEFYTTGDESVKFREFASQVFNREIKQVNKLEL